jgi:tRNA pseudouridine55 synthase
MYSAVKIGGTKLYEYARKGLEVERKPRDIVVSSIKLIEKSGDDFILGIVCSKGTYVRTLCHDIGVTLGCGGCMSSLRRTRAGSFCEAQTVTLQQVETRSLTEE